MTTAEMADLVRRWFKKAEQGSGPILPDGWFGGRAHDNTFWLTDVQPSNHDLVVRLTDDTTLHFERPARVFIEDSELVFEGYAQATLRWKHYGGGPDAPYYEKRYDSGQVRLAPPVGTTVDLS